MTAILLAPDKFKGSLDAAGVADALAAGVADADPGRPVRCSPVADGGEGTVLAALAAGWSPVRVATTGPTGRPLTATYARRGRTALVELAATSGLAVLPSGRPSPMDAGTEGLGTVLAHALDGGADEIVLGLGGSATTDGGAGLLRGLGARVLDADGATLPPGGAALARADRLDLTGLHPRARSARFVLACDVDNPLLGPDGAAAVYGPQKGATPDQVADLDAALTRWAAVLDSAASTVPATAPAAPAPAAPAARAQAADTAERAAPSGTVVTRQCRSFADAPGAGAAGGAGFALTALLGATHRSGVDTVLELTGFADALAEAALVVTGEGRLDRQTLHGKAPAGVAAAARAAGVPVVAVAGECLLTPAEARDAGFAAVHALVDVAGSRAEALADAAGLLRRVGARIARSPTPLSHGKETA